jgi:hypothetical protein
MEIKQGVGKHYNLDCIGNVGKLKTSKTPKYKLMVEGAGNYYAEDSLFRLGITLLSHRFLHLLHGQGWKD